MIDPISPIVFGAGVSSMLFNLLSKSASKEERLRQAKVIVRTIIQEVDEAHPSYLYQTHEKASTALKAVGHAVIDDLPSRRQEEFGKACGAFVKSTDSEIHPVVTPSSFEGKRSPEAEAIEQENWRKPGKLLKERLIAVLNCL